MFQEHAEHARQHEVLRAMAAGFLIALIAGLFAYVGAESAGGHKARVAGALVCAISILGWLLNYKHYERYRRNTTIRRGYPVSLEAKITPGIRTIHAQCRAYHKARFPFTSEHLPLHRLWAGVYVVTFIAGFAALVGIISLGDT
jgi:hypothetical protein